ncbi:spore coat U domain-containing protein [Lysobacter sp. A03]|uniref:Csu type fimbrial protein n=1 Tax=Lysobacter sp. A03 TaxID=1199154 RepID=UPI0006971C6D|nr:spore coat U domain-containing protein [Lysobacter sp. A03]
MTMNLKPLLLTAAMVAAGLTVSTAYAQSVPSPVTANMGVQIEIVEGCEINVTPTLMNFGTHSVLSTAQDATSDFEVTCTTGASYDIALGGGNSADINARVMLNGTEEVQYQLYQEAGHTTVWGDGAEGALLAGTGTGATQPYTVYGEVPAQTTPPEGVYTDTVLVSVIY